VIAVKKTLQKMTIQKLLLHKINTKLIGLLILEPIK